MTIRQRLLTFVLVGAGPIGVEMAGGLAELAHARLAGFPEKLADFARRSLERMGVEVLLDTPIEAIDGQGVVAKGERLEAANVIWCAGVEASPVAKRLSTGDAL